MTPILTSFIRFNRQGLLQQKKGLKLPKNANIEHQQKNCCCSIFFKQLDPKKTSQHHRTSPYTVNIIKYLLHENGRSLSATDAFMQRKDGVHDEDVPGAAVGLQHIPFLHCRTPSVDDRKIQGPARCPMKNYRLCGQNHQDFYRI